MARKKSERTKEAEANRLIRNVEDDLLEVQDVAGMGKLKKGIDFSNALRYIKNIAKIKQKGKAMENKTTTKKTNTKKGKSVIKTIVASIIAAPFIIMGVASLVQSNVPYMEYAIGALVAGFVVYLLNE